MQSETYPATGPVRRFSPFSFQFDARIGLPLRRTVWRLAAPAACALLLAGSARAQNASQSGTGGMPRPDHTQGLDAPAAPDVMSHADEERLSIRRITERQKTIVADTARLLQLAQELKEDVDRSNKDQLSIAVVKKAEEVEKLAKSVKEKMKGF